MLSRFSPPLDRSVNFSAFIPEKRLHLASRLVSRVTSFSKVSGKVTTEDVIHVKSFLSLGRIKLGYGISTARRGLSLPLFPPRDWIEFFKQSVYILNLKRAERTHVDNG